MDDARRKVMAGSQLKRLRGQLGLSQTAMAAELGISTSYLNLVERNQRPLTAQLLIRLSETYSVDAHAFVGSEDAGALAELEEVVADPLLRPLGVPRAELRAALEEAPTLAAALRRLHAAYQGLSELGDDVGGTERGEAPGRGPGPGPSPASRPGSGPGAGAAEAVERVRAFLQARSNHFPTLEEAAERIAEGLDGDLLAACARRLSERHGLRVEVLPASRMGVSLRHLDRHRRKLMISELLMPPGRAFQAAYQLALLEAGEAIDATLDGEGLGGPRGTPGGAPGGAPGPGDAQARRLGRITLANYVAAAVMMPYAPFLAAAQELLYDVDLLCARFGASWEQAAHRLTTLGRPSARGVPLFMLRLDQAGNVSKRFSSGAFPFSRQGGTCPRWAIHAAFASPGRVVAQTVELPDGRRFVTFARSLRRVTLPFGEPEASVVVALGCEERFGAHLAYGRALKGQAAVGIGVNCRLCERPSCPSRAAPSILGPLEVAEGTRGLSPFGG